MTSPATPSPTPAPGGLDPVIRGHLLRYRVMASVVGVLLVVLILVGVPLANFDGTGMWGIFPSTPDLWAAGSTPHAIGEGITEYLGVAHGWLYMIFLITAFLLSRAADWDLGFTLVTLVCGTVPVLSFWAEHRATRRVRAEWSDPVLAGSAPTPTTPSATPPTTPPSGS